MVEVLLPHMEEVYAKPSLDSQHGRTRSRRPRNAFAEGYLSLRGSHVSSILSKEIVEGEGNTKLCAELLALGEIEALEDLPQLGVDFTPRPDELGLLKILGSCGYPSLLERLGKTVKESWVDGQPSANNKKNIAPFLITACQRTLPNLDVIKVLVEKLPANVNFQPPSELSGRETPILTALHTLAWDAIGGNSKHWNLLLYGADPELKTADVEPSFM